MRKRIEEKPIRWVPIWIALGAAIGVPFNNIPIGVGFGTGIGFFLFIVLSFRNKKIFC